MYAIFVKGERTIVSRCSLEPWRQLADTPCSLTCVPLITNAVYYDLRSLWQVGLNRKEKLTKINVALAIFSAHAE